MSYDYTTIHLACRTKALTLSVCTTGSVTLASTLTGYTRASGSFVTDGFSPGMEITVAGFTSNPTSTITSVGALTMTVKDARSVETASAGRTLSVGLPASRAFENSQFTPVTGVPYVEENFLPGPSRRVTIGPLAQLELSPMYSLKVNVPSNTGIVADGRYADALINLFTPSTAITLSSGDILRVRDDTGPYRGQRLPSGSGFSVVPVTVPFWMRTTNSI
jgi:hypothetical protein